MSSCAPPPFVLPPSVVEVLRAGGIRSCRSAESTATQLLQRILLGQDGDGTARVEAARNREASQKLFPNLVREWALLSNKPRTFGFEDAALEAVAGDVDAAVARLMLEPNDDGVREWCASALLPELVMQFCDIGSSPSNYNVNCIDAVLLAREAVMQNDAQAQQDNTKMQQQLQQHHHQNMDVELEELAEECMLQIRRFRVQAHYANEAQRARIHWLHVLQDELTRHLQGEEEGSSTRHQVVAKPPTQLELWLLENPAVLRKWEAEERLRQELVAWRLEQEAPRLPAAAAQSSSRARLRRALATGESRLARGLDLRVPHDEDELFVNKSTAARDDDHDVPSTTEELMCDLDGGEESSEVDLDYPAWLRSEWGRVKPTGGQPGAELLQIAQTLDAIFPRNYHVAPRWGRNTFSREVGPADEGTSDSGSSRARHGSAATSKTVGTSQEELLTFVARYKQALQKEEEKEAGLLSKETEDGAASVKTSSASLSSNCTADQRIAKRLMCGPAGRAGSAQANTAPIELATLPVFTPEIIISRREGSDA